MRTLTFASLLAFTSTAALASADHLADSRQLSAAALCGATNTACQQAYITGAKDGTAAFKRVLVTYKAIRAAEVPTPPPAPPPSPPPPPTASGVTSEGDSISVLWGGNHVGIWSSSRPDVPLKSLAVGGSGLNDLIARKANIGTPKVFTVLIGANDLTSYSSGKAYADAVIAYIGPVRAAGAKVAVGTILPQVSTNSAYQLKFDAYRAEYNASIKASGAIDAVIDFGAPQLQADGVHPTDAGQAAMAPAYKAVVDALLAGETVPPPPPPPPPPSPPPPSGEVLYPIAAIPSNFDVASELVPAWGTGAIPPSAAPDVVGAFRFICNASHLAYDDPIVYPGQPGKSHLHQFYGNTGANANSTFASLRTSGNSTCNSPLNRSAYWMPAFLDGLGNVVIPDYVQVYYKRRMRTDPRCTLGNANAEGDCVNLPNGLRFIFGYDMATMTKGNGAPYYDCQGPTTTPGHYYANQNGLAMVATKCGPGNLLGAVIAGPNCWDGVHLDVPDHRSHMAYMVRNVATGQMACPVTHPKVIPQFTISAWYKVEPVAGVQFPVQNWSLSSDAMPGMTMAQGSTLHFDYFEGWDEGVKKAWHDACIDGLKNASGGDICDGRQLKMFAGFKWAASPNRVPIPARP